MRALIVAAVLAVACVMARAQDGERYYVSYCVSNDTIVATCVSRPATNAATWYTTNAPNAYLDSDNHVRELARAGRICAVFGHQWRGGRLGESETVSFADYHPGTSFRTCKICGKCESQRLGDWN